MHRLYVFGGKCCFWTLFAVVLTLYWLSAIPMAIISIVILWSCFAVLAIMYLALNTVIYVLDLQIALHAPHPGAFAYHMMMCHFG